MNVLCHIVLMLSLTLLGACSVPTVEKPHLPSPEICPFVYVAAPGNFIVDIASGSEVILDPAYQDFELFCDAKEARESVQRRVESGDLPQGDWRIYRLEGQMEDLAEIDGGRLVLARMGEIVDWVTDQPSMP
ncbi:MAG: SON protein [Desulfovibrio sp.]|nr:SON protein [Desulfovibrio sp.]